MTLFHVAIMFICMLMGIGVGRIFGHAYVQQGGIFGLLIGFVMALTPYPFRFISWLFDRKRCRKQDEKNGRQ